MLLQIFEQLEQFLSTAPQEGTTPSQLSDFKANMLFALRDPNYCDVLHRMEQAKPANSSSMQAGLAKVLTNSGQSEAQASDTAAKVQKEVEGMTDKRTAVLDLLRNDERQLELEIDDAVAKQAPSNSSMSALQISSNLDFDLGSDADSHAVAIRNGELDASSHAVVSKGFFSGLFTGLWAIFLHGVVGSIIGQVGAMMCVVTFGQVSYNRRGRGLVLDARMHSADVRL